MIITIDPTARISLSRSNGVNAALLQIKETNGWETRATKLYDAGIKGNELVDDMKKVHREYIQKVEYDRSKLEPYH